MALLPTLDGPDRADAGSKDTIRCRVLGRRQMTRVAWKPPVTNKLTTRDFLPVGTLPR